MPERQRTIAPHRQATGARITEVRAADTADHDLDHNIVRPGTGALYLFDTNIVRTVNRCMKHQFRHSGFLHFRL